MNLNLSKSELIKYHNKEDIICQTARQVIKDFALFGLQIEFPENITYAYQELYIQLEEQVQDLLAINSQKLLSILYQIDIPEKKIQREASYAPDKNLSDVITELILERELKKVLTRLYFKEHGF